MFFYKNRKLVTEAGVTAVTAVTAVTDFSVPGPQPSSHCSTTLFFFGYGAFLAFSIASGRWGTAQERGARGLTRF